MCCSWDTVLLLIWSTRLLSNLISLLAMVNVHCDNVGGESCIYMSFRNWIKFNINGRTLLKNSSRHCFSSVNFRPNSRRNWAFAVCVHCCPFAMHVCLRIHTGSGPLCEPASHAPFWMSYVISSVTLHYTVQGMQKNINANSVRCVVQLHESHTCRSLLCTWSNPLTCILNENGPKTHLHRVYAPGTC